MVTVAERLMRLTVDQDFAGSNPVGHPIGGNVDFKKNLKCFVSAIILIVPVSLVFNAPSWAFAIGIIITYLLFCVIQELDDLKKKMVD